MKMLVRAVSSSGPLLPRRMKTNGQLAGRLAELVFYGLGPDDVEQYADRVAAADAVAVRKAIDEDFPLPANLAMVLIGDAAAIRDTARQYGPLTEMKLTDPAFAPK